MHRHCAVKCAQLRRSNWDLWPRAGTTDFSGWTVEDRSTLRGKVVSVNFNWMTFSLRILHILHFLTLASAPTRVCVKYTSALPSTFLPAVIHHSPRMIWRALIILVNFHESCYRWLCRVRLRGLRSSWRCVDCWKCVCVGGVGGVDTVAAPQCCGQLLPYIWAFREEDVTRWR